MFKLPPLTRKALQQAPRDNIFVYLQLKGHGDSPKYEKIREWLVFYGLLTAEVMAEIDNSEDDNVLDKKET